MNTHLICLPSNGFYNCKNKIRKILKSFSHLYAVNVTLQYEDLSLSDTKRKRAEFGSVREFLGGSGGLDHAC